MNTYCIPLAEVLVLLCYERDFMMSLTDYKQADIFSVCKTFIQIIGYFKAKYTQKKKFSQYLCFLIKSTILDISLSNFIYELYYRSFTCIRLLCDK